MAQDNPQQSRVSVEQLNTLQLRMNVLSQLAGIGDAMQGADPNNSTAQLFSEKVVRGVYRAILIDLIEDLGRISDTLPENNQPGA